MALPEIERPSTTGAELADWLERIGHRRDFSIPPPSSGPWGDALRALLGVLSTEFTDYRSVAAGARAAAQRNAAELRAIVASTDTQVTRIGHAALAVKESGQGASHVAKAAAELQRFAIEATTAADGATEGMTEIGSSLHDLGAQLTGGRKPIAAMERSTSGVGSFLSSLASLSRQAQVLSVNAAIEAAHLADDGARFALVALEVRKLSSSTRTSATDVSRIVAELRDATTRVASAIDEAERATAAADGELAATGRTLLATQRSIGDFEEMTTSIAAVANEQSASLAQVVGAIDEIVRHADEAARASRTAATLDLDRMLVDIDTAAGRWTLLPTAHGFALGDDPLVSWLMHVGFGTPGAAPADRETRELTAGVLALIERVDADQRAIVEGIVEIAVAVARNGFAWRTITHALHALHGELANVRTAIDQATRGARTAAELAVRMRELVGTMQKQYDAALLSLEGALERVNGIATNVSGIDRFVDTMTGAATKAGEIMGLIDTLSSETDLLSLNAAIEAAHAGEAGRGFGVIAEEIRTLALTTHESTRQVSQLVDDVVTISEAIRGSVSAAGSGTSDVTATAQRVGALIGSLHASFGATVQRALDVSTTAEQQSRALDRVLVTVDESVAAVDADAARATDERRLELATLGSRVHAIAGRRGVPQTTAKIRVLGDRIADATEAIIEQALDAGRTTLAALHAGTYVEAVGPQIAKLARLFDVHAVPPAGFTPPKFTTDWEAAFDEPLMVLLDAFMDEGAFARPATMALCDLNGFSFANPARLVGDWTGDPERDRRGNRVKRMLEDDYALRVTRWGLGNGVERIGPRVPYSTFRAAGCDLDRPHGDRPWGVYVYARDLADIYNELTVALYVRGTRFGTLRLVYPLDIF